MPDVDSPFAAFSFLLEAGGVGEVTAPIGGFSAVSAVGTTMTLKRGIVMSGDLVRWIAGARADPAYTRDLFLTLRDENGHPARRWHMRDARIASWTGPGAGLPGSSVCAIEEIVIAAMAIDIVN